MANIIKGKNPVKPYTVRYREQRPPHKQREKSFRTRKEADRFLSDLTRAASYGEDLNLTAAKASFTDAVEHWLSAVAVNERTRETYASNYHSNILDVYASLSVRDAASDRQTAEKLLNVTMIDKSVGTRRMARHILVSVLDSLVVNGTIAAHRLAGIKLAEKTVTEDESEQGGFVYITDDQVKTLAGQCGIVVWLQRTMGLRISEALGVEKSDFINGGSTLRLRWQATRDGKSRVPLKKRRVGQYRDVPVPVFVQKLIADLPDGPLAPGRTTAYRPYNTARDCFYRAVRAMGVEGFTTHSLRHQFASEWLADGGNLADLSAILGHADATVTLRTYVHPSENVQDTARASIDARWASQ